MSVTDTQAEHMLSSLQLKALKIAWMHLGCDEDVDGLTNELLSEHFPVFSQHRNHHNPKYRQMVRSGLWEQFESLCELEGWQPSDRLDWFEGHLDGPVRFRDILGGRLIYPGRFFNRKAIGNELSNAAFADVRRALQKMSSQNLIRTIGNVGYTLTEQGIALARSLFPGMMPFKTGNPQQHADELSIRRLIHERRQRPLESTI
ncbi:MAG: hypothetical protein AAGA40_04090 [Cyanobacteria bacterium P01_E01_bin.45]